MKAEKEYRPQMRQYVTQHELLRAIRRRVMGIANEVYDPENPDDYTIANQMERSGMTRALDVVEDEFRNKRVVLDA